MAAHGIGNPGDRILELAQDRARFNRAQDAFTNAQAARTVYFGRPLLPTFLTAYFVRREVMDEEVIPTTETLLGLVEEFAHEALRDPALYRHLGLREDARDLLEIDPGYKRVVVISRPDAVLDPRGRLKFFEINTDSPAMMTFSDLLYELLSEGFPLTQLTEEGYQLSYDTMTDKLLASLLDCWREWGGSGKPTMVMTDFNDVKTFHEQRRIAERFTAAGVETLICDPRELKFRDGTLYANRVPVQMVYRRVLAEEIFDGRRDLADLIAAYRSGKICMVNPLRSYVAATKAVLPLLSDELGKRFTRPELTECLPRTRRATVEMTADLLANPGKYVLKKGVSHGGADVVIGAQAKPEAWKHAVGYLDKAPWIVQDFVDIPKLDVPIGGDGPAKQNKFVNWNPFIFGGKVAGSIARVSDEPLINICAGGGLLPTICYRKVP